MWSEALVKERYAMKDTAVGGGESMLERVLGRGHTILTSRELTSRNVCDNRNVRAVLARGITWRKQSDRSMNLRHRIQWQIASHIPTARVTSHELTSRELMWCYACSSDVRGNLPLNSMAQIHTSVTLLTSRDPKCQHASHISVVAHISWDVTTWPRVSSALHTLSISCLQKNILFMSAAALKPIRLECYLLRLPGAKSSHEITWHDDTCACRLTWREDSVSPA